MLGGDKGEVVCFNIREARGKMSMGVCSKENNLIGKEISWD